MWTLPALAISFSSTARCPEASQWPFQVLIPAQQLSCYTLRIRDYSLKEIKCKSYVCKRESLLFHKMHTARGIVSEQLFYRFQHPHLSSDDTAQSRLIFNRFSFLPSNLLSVLKARGPVIFPRRRGTTALPFPSGRLQVPNPSTPLVVP